MEYVIWGIKDGEKYESILMEDAKTEERAREMVEVLKNKYKCKEIRIQKLNLSTPYNFLHFN